MKFYTVVYDCPDTCAPMFVAHFANYDEALQCFNEVDPKRDYENEWAASTAVKPKKQVFEKFLIDDEKRDELHEQIIRGEL